MVGIWWLRMAAWAKLWLRAREGQALVEYGLILILASVAALLALHFLGGVTEHSLNNTAGMVNSA